MWRDDALVLIDNYLAGSMGVADFCAAFEESWNFDRPSDQPLGAEESVFKRIFDAAVWYSPIEEERKRIPGYLDEAAIQVTVRNARDELR